MSLLTLNAFSGTRVPRKLENYPNVYGTSVQFHVENRGRGGEMARDTCISTGDERMKRRVEEEEQEENDSTVWKTIPALFPHERFKCSM